MTDQLKEDPQQEPTYPRLNVYNEDPQQEPTSQRLSVPLECPKCGADRVACDVKAHYVITISPRDKGFLDFRSSDLSAAACPHCGYTELYANQHFQLLPKP